MNRASLSLSLALLIAPNAATQQTVVVQGGGLAFRTAVQAASPGDTLVVMQGTYSGAVIDIGITVKCQGAVIFNVPVFASVGGGTLVLDIPLGQTFKLSGCRVPHVHTYPSLVARGDGIMLFEHVRLGNRPTFVGRQIALHRCQLASRVVVGDAAASVTNFAMSNCTTDGVQVYTNVDASVVGGTYVGGFELNSGRLTVAGSGTTISMGVGSSTAAIRNRGGSLTLDPKVQIISAHPAAVSGSVTRRVVPTVSTNSVAAGQTLRVIIEAESGSSTHLVGALGVRSIVNLAPFGQLWFGSNHFVLNSGVVPDDGLRVVSQIVPSQLPLDVALVLQAVSVTARGDLLVGPPVIPLIN